jgi:hypothetical protein
MEDEKLLGELTSKPNVHILSTMQKRREHLALHSRQKAALKGVIK